jgi:hypothetical protein
MNEPHRPGRARLRRIAPLARRPIVAADWGTGEIVAADLDGSSEVTGAGPPKVNVWRAEEMTR